jgi:glutamate synthase (NADPH/NADH) large chain
LDFTPVLHYEKAPGHVGTYKKIDQNHHLEEALDWQLIEAIDQSKSSKDLAFPILNTHRSVGTLLSGHLIRQKKMITQPVKITFTGSAGQSFGAFLAKGLDFHLMGEANDYVGKGLSGGIISIKPNEHSTLTPDEHIIIGNVTLYGATSGEIYVNGQAGERFCVRNSGAEAVVEGIGDHGCEYMTGGLAIILGAVGSNFGAGMSGGTAYVYDEKNNFSENCNMEMIDIDPLKEDDTNLLHAKLNEHIKRTDSPKAIEILNHWDTALKYFKKVMPIELKRVLANQKTSKKVA